MPRLNSLVMLSTFGVFRIFHFDVAEEPIRPSELVRELRHDDMVGQALEQGIDNLVAPLERPVRCSDRTAGLELGGCREQVDTVLLVTQNSRERRIRVDHDQHVEFLHGRLHFLQTGLGIRGVAPEYHGANRRRLIGVGRILQHTVNPAADRGIPERFISAFSLPSAPVVVAN